jgi:hypothetical protein
MSDEQADGCGEWARVLCGPGGDAAADLVVAVMAEAIVLLRRQAAWRRPDLPAADEAVN